MEECALNIGKHLILLDFERNRPVKILKVIADNEIWVRMPEGDSMQVNLSDLADPKTYKRNE